MRKFAALYLLALSLLVCAAAGAQTTIPLKNALDEVTRIFGTKFVYERSTIGNKTTTVNVEAQKDQPVEKVLKSILYPNNLLFLYIDVNHYTIVRNDKKSIPVPGTVDVPAPAPSVPQDTAVEGKISGIVVSADDRPLSGVSITAPEGGAITDLNGRFSVSAKANDIVTLTSVGYRPLSVRLKASGQRLVMTLDQRQIDEVVVIAYGSQSRKDLTGSISTISGKDIAELPPTVNLEQALQGRAAGVMVVQESGQPGSATRVRIRGSSSLLGSNQPLYVVDGIPVVAEGNIPDDGSTFNTAMIRQGLNSPLGNINTEDIESISVLKDASATAIYGSRAANGVVIVTTKKGRGKPVYTFSSSLSYQKAQTEKMLNAQQFREIWTEAANNTTSTAAIVQDIKDGSYFGNDNTDWSKEVTPGDPLTKNVNFSVSGGTDKIKYYSSLGVQDQMGGFQNAYFKRYSFLLNLNLAVSRRINLGTSVNLSSSTQGSPDAALLSRIYSFRPDLPVYDSAGNYSFSNYHNFENPVALAAATNTNRTGLLLGSIFGDIMITDGLVFKSSLAVNYNTGKQRSFYPSFTGTGGFTRTGPGPGFAQESNTETYSTLWENTLTYDKTFADKHVVNAVLGASWQGDNQEFLKASGKGFPQDFTLTNLSSATQDFTIASTKQQSGLISYFGRVNYQYNDKYMLTLSARADGSSKFASENKWAFFPTAAAAWRISEERIFSSLQFIDDLKIRASIGMTGQQNFGPYQWRTLFEAANYGGMPAVVQSQLGNSRLKWELTRQTDIGLDFSLFRGRLNGAFDIYEKNTTDLLYFYKAPGNTGAGNVIGNLGNTKNNGMELSLDGDIIRNGSFTWNLGINLARNRNRLVKLNDDFLNKSTGFITPPNTGSVLQPGQPIGLLYGYIAEGIFQTQEEIDALNAAAGGFYQAAGTSPGDIKFRDIDGDGKVNASDQTIIGNAVPDFSGGFTNAFEFKGLRLSSLFVYAVGNDLRWGTQAQAINFTSAALENKMAIVLNRWTPENGGSQPRVVYGDPNSNGRVSSFYVHDASFLRLKNVHLSYNFPGGLLSGTRFIKTAMVYVSGTNLLTFTKYPGANPETSNLYNDDVSTGLDNSRFPIAKVYTVGLRVGF